MIKVNLRTDAFSGNVPMLKALRSGVNTLFGQKKSHQIVAFLALVLVLMLALAPVALLLFYPTSKTVDAYAPITVYGITVIASATYYVYTVMRTGETVLRIQQFVKDNNFHLDYSSQSVGLISLFADRGLLESQYVISGLVKGHVFQMSRWLVYRRTKQGRRRTIKTWATMSVELTKHLPHMIFDNKKNNVGPFSNLPVDFSAKQLDSFEGDLHKFYKIYVPENYGRDVRTIFTPEVLLVLRDIAEYGYDVEIIDNRLTVFQVYANYHKTIVPMMLCGLKLAFEVEDEAHNYVDERSKIVGMIANNAKRLKPSYALLFMRSLPAAVFGAYLGFMLLYTSEAVLVGMLLAVFLQFIVNINKLKRL